MTCKELELHSQSRRSLYCLSTSKGVQLLPGNQQAEPSRLAKVQIQEWKKALQDVGKKVARKITAARTRRKAWISQAMSIPLDAQETRESSREVMNELAIATALESGCIQSYQEVQNAQIQTSQADRALAQTATKGHSIVSSAVSLVRRVSDKVRRGQSVGSQETSQMLHAAPFVSMELLAGQSIPASSFINQLPPQLLTMLSSLRSQTAPRRMKTWPISSQLQRQSRTSWIYQRARVNKAL